MPQEFWVAKLPKFSLSLSLSSLLFIPYTYCIPPVPSIFIVRETAPLFRTHRRYPLLQLIRKPIYCQSRSVEWLASWISARLLNTCNSLFSFSLVCAFATQDARQYDLIHLPVSSFSWLTVCGWIVMPFTWVNTNPRLILIRDASLLYIQELLLHRFREKAYLCKYKNPNALNIFVFCIKYICSRYRISSHCK